MADVTSDRDRGQLILVTGLLVAVTMVALVLLLNTAIYTDNLASRGADQSGREAVEYRATVIDGVGGLIDEENDREHGSYGGVESNVTEGIDTIDNLTGRSYATGGTVVRINQSSSSLTVSEGKLVRQTNSSRRFRNTSGALDDWRLASGVEDDEIRGFEVTVNRTSLESDVDYALHVRLEDGSDVWRAYVYEDGSNVTVAIQLGVMGPKTDVCTVAASNATIDLTRGEIEGQPCPGLNWSEGLTGDYIVGYRNGENATGTYDVTIDSTSASINSTNIDSSPSDTVYHVPAVYSASFEISYESPTLTYRTDVRVAPGEPR